LRWKRTFSILINTRSKRLSLCSSVVVYLNIETIRSAIRKRRKKIKHEFLIVLALVRRESVHITFAICIDALGIRSHCFRQRDVWRYQCSRRRQIGLSIKRTGICTDICNVSQENRSREKCGRTRKCCCDRQSAEFRTDLMSSSSIWNRVPLCRLSHRESNSPRFVHGKNDFAEVSKN